MKLAKHLANGKIIYFCNDNARLEVVENKHFRWLLLDNVVQSIINKRASHTLTLPHQIGLMLPLLFNTPENILILGLGGGDLHRFLLRITPTAQLTTIESNQTIIQCYQTYFSQGNNQHTIIESDVFKWVKKQNQLDYEWIIVDIFSAKLDDSIWLTFIVDCLNKVKNNTYVSINITDSSEKHLNALFTLLKKYSGSITYFMIPHYQNVIVHILVAATSPLIKVNYSTTLPDHLAHRWARYWQYGGSITGTGFSDKIKSSTEKLPDHR